MKKQNNGFWISITFGILCTVSTIYGIIDGWWFGVIFSAFVAGLNFRCAQKNYRRW
jgi:nicotinamide riboside transporter PnuC